MKKEKKNQIFFNHVISRNMKKKEKKKELDENFRNDEQVKKIGGKSG